MCVGNVLYIRMLAYICSRSSRSPSYFDFFLFFQCFQTVSVHTITHQSSEINRRAKRNLPLLISSYLLPGFFHTMDSPPSCSAHCCISKTHGDAPRCSEIERQQARYIIVMHSWGGKWFRNGRVPVKMVLRFLLSLTATDVN